MQKKEEELEAEIRSLREEIKWLKDNLKIKDQLHQNYREAHVHNQVLEETRKQVPSPKSIYPLFLFFRSLSIIRYEIKIPKKGLEFLVLH